MGKKLPCLLVSGGILTFASRTEMGKRIDMCPHRDAYIVNAARALTKAAREGDDLHEVMDELKIALGDHV